jgi:hypothetical protein
MWEYKTIELITLEPMTTGKVLNTLGKMNWELVSDAFADQGLNRICSFEKKATASRWSRHYKKRWLTKGILPGVLRNKSKAGKMKGDRVRQVVSTSTA